MSTLGEWRGWADMSREGGRVSRPTIVPLLPPYLPLLWSMLLDVRRPAAVLLPSVCSRDELISSRPACVHWETHQGSINNTPGTWVVTKHNEFHFSGNHVFDLAGLSLRWIVWINESYCTLHTSNLAKVENFCSVIIIPNVSKSQERRQHFSWWNGLSDGQQASVYVDKLAKRQHGSPAVATWN